MKNTRKFYAMIIAIIMLMSSFMMIFNNISFAMEPDAEQPGDEQPADEPGDGPQERTFIVDFGTASWVVNGVTVTANTQWTPLPAEGPVEIGERDLIRVSNFDNDTMQIVVKGENNFQSKLSLVSADETTIMSADAEHLPDELTFVVEAKPQEEGENPVNPPAQAGGPDNIEFDASFTKTRMHLSINNKNVTEAVPVDEKNPFKGTISNAGNADATKTNELRFQAEFGDYPLKEVTINGVVYREGDEGVEVAKNEKGVIIDWCVTVAGADKYVISGEGDENAIISRTIIWVNPDYVPQDEEDAEWVKQFTIEHGYAKVIEVYDENDQKLQPDEYIGENADEYGLNNGFGWIEVYQGYRVVFELEPEYGYQLTEIRLNETPLEAIDDIVNRFEVVIPGGNLHLAATYSKTDDELRTESEKVLEGTVTLPENTLDAGTAQLRVKDIELDPEKIKGFEAAAEGMEIKNYLDIDLYQVFYKGKDDDEDVWENKIDELDEEVEISFQLRDGLKLEDVVIVHNVHDGDEYEIIEITSYDEATNTITFKTKSFSGYAIALKDGREPTQITLTDATTKVVVSFEDLDGHNLEDFEFMALDITNLTDTQIAELGIPKTEYEKGLEKIKEASKEYGGLIVLYNIQVRIPAEDRDLTDGPFELKIPQTDALKEYESIKLAYVDSEDFSLKDVIELKLEDGYYVGTLEHLSPYALVGKAVEPTQPTNTSNNPSTGDNIVVFGSIFVLSALAMAFELFIIKKSRIYR